MIEEHLRLFKLDKKYFLYKNSSNYPIELLNYIKDKYYKKKSPKIKESIEEVKEFIELTLEKFRKEDDKKVKNLKTNSDEIKNVFEPMKVFVKKNDFMIHISISDNKPNFFYDLDKNYITNIKKEIMNCIFSYYYLDEFFYSRDFCIIKKYYMNNYLVKKEAWDTKKLNFPSTIKNYRNNFEPPLFVKKFNNYVTNPYFPINHSYIKNESLKSKLNMERSIKLYPKEFLSGNNDKEIECEFIKNENAYYGKLYYNNYGNYLLFKEKTKNFKEEEGFEHIFLLSNYFENQKKKNNKAEIFNKRDYSKNILIFLDDIEEIIEMRIFLLWKGFEIFLKNGKSYIFNFLTTKDYNNFMENYMNKSKINKLIRKRNFVADENDITKNWKQNLLTNYEYLLILNRYSSRSFNDPSQYPVFPWLLNDYKNLDLFYKQEKNFEIIKNEYKNIKKEINNNNGIKSTFKKETLDKNDIFLIKEVKNFVQDELQKDEILFLEYIISKLETTLENNINRDIQNNQIRKKSFFKKKHKSDEENLRDSNTGFIEDDVTFNYSQYFKFLKKANKKIKKILRNFNYPPSIHDESKKSRLKLKFEDSSDLKFHFHHGIHYSNSVYIFYFLMRQQPYDNLLIKAQSYHLEDPNRTFVNLIDLNELTISGNDNRELIPELFSKIEMFLNLNCDLYGVLQINNKIVDDYEIDYSFNNKKNPLSDYVYLILKHKNILNNKLVGSKLKNWIDIIFGYMQLPPVDKRSESYNIFEKESYEKMVNLENKLEKNLNKKEKINHIINFGVTPSLLFKKKHPKLKWIIENNNNKTNEKEKNNNVENKENHSMEEIIKEVVRPKQLFYSINENPIFFSINPSINRIFVYNKEDNLIILDSQIFNEISYKYFSILKDYLMEKTNILYSKENQVYQIKYGFSSFNKENAFDDGFNSYHTYYYNKINYLINQRKIKTETNNNKFDSFLIITCRHIDFSFKIYYFENNNQKNKNIIKKSLNKYKIRIYSYFCEDFVTCCRCVSNNAFIIGLNNGKLIYYTLNNKEMIMNNNQAVDKKVDITLKKEIYIQGHHGKINTIEIDKRLGVVITSGDDNYIFVRKLYDFELLFSSYNFLYILCFNKINNKKIIFGYTLSGMKFAKSEYALYDNINFDEAGNIITMNNKKDFTILSGSDLTNLNDLSNGENAIKGIQNTNWLQFDYYMEGRDEEFNKIITFLGNDDKQNCIKACLYK